MSQNKDINTLVDTIVKLNKLIHTSRLDTEVPYLIKIKRKLMCELKTSALTEQEIRDIDEYIQYDRNDINCIFSKTEE